jgi:hypothetical protein
VRAATHQVQQVLPGRIEAELAASPPALVREQRMRSLGRANQIRTARAALKDDLASGRAQIEDVLTHTPACAATAKVSDLLLAVPGVGPTRVTRALTRCHIPYAKAAAALTERQRAALIALLRPEQTQGDGR